MSHAAKYSYSSVQTIRANREDCNALAEQICAHLVLIAQTYHPELRGGDTGLVTETERPRLHAHVVALHEYVERSVSVTRPDQYIVVQDAGRRARRR